MRADIINVMTIDVEDYFHVSVFDGVVPRSQWDRLESRVCRNTDRLLDLLNEHAVRATFFILGWVAERHPSLIARIAAAGHELACHSHEHRLVYDLTREQFRADVRRAKAAIEDASGRRVAGYRAPSYSITPRSLWALDVLIEEGFTYDASIFPIHHDRYGIPLSPRHPYVVRREAGTIIEVPASTIRLGPLNLPVAGGGYFRMLPYEWARTGIAHLNRVERRSAVFYLHPWEIDPEQPRLATSKLGQLRHYRNLDKTEERLRTLISEFPFSTVMHMLGSEVSVDCADTLALPLPYVW